MRDIRKCMDIHTADFDWNHVRAFLASARAGSLSRAARTLHTTQPTLSRQVAALEAALGVTLFERVGKGVQLTLAGEKLLQHAEQMEAQATAFALSASGESVAMQGRVTLSASEIDAMFRLPAVIALLQQLEPGIEIDVVVTNAASDLKRREADIALRSFRPSEPDLIARKLFDEPCWFFGRRTYLDRLAGRTDDELFTQIRIIGFDDNTPLFEMVNRAGWRIGPANIACTSHSHILHWHLVKAGIGLSIFPEAIGRQDPDLAIALPGLGAPVTVPLWLVCHRELRTNPRVRRVFEVLGEMLGG